MRYSDPLYSHRSSKAEESPQANRLCQNLLAKADAGSFLHRFEKLLLYGDRFAVPVLDGEWVDRGELPVPDRRYSLAKESERGNPSVAVTADQAFGFGEKFRPIEEYIGYT